MWDILSFNFAAVPDRTVYPFLDALVLFTMASLKKDILKIHNVLACIPVPINRSKSGRTAQAS